MNFATWTTDDDMKLKTAIDADDLSAFQSLHSKMFKYQAKKTEGWVEYGITEHDWRFSLVMQVRDTTEILMWLLSELSFFL